MIGIILVLLTQTSDAGVSFQVRAARDIEPLPRSCIYYNVPSWLTGYDLIFAAEGILSTVNRELYDAVNASPEVLSKDSDATLEDLVSFYRGSQLFFSSDYPAASEHFSKLVRDYPQRPIADFSSYYLGAIAFNKGNYEQCIRSLKNVTLSKNVLLAGNANFTRAQAFLELNRSDSAIIAFEEARSRGRNTMIDLYSTYALYRIYHSRGKLKERDTEAARLAEIKLGDGGERITVNLALLVQGNVKFLEGNYEAALEYFEKITEPRYDSQTSIEELLVYEAKITMSSLALIRQDELTDAEIMVSRYLEVFSNRVDSQVVGESGAIAAGYGPSLRAHLIFNLAAAHYLDSYDAEGMIENTSRREEARRLLLRLTEGFAEAEIADLANVALAWFMLEVSDFDNSLQVFTDIYENSDNMDARVLASYGRALSSYHVEDYSSAYSWFLDENAYEKELSLTLDSTVFSRGLSYNAIAADIADEALLWKAQSAEMLTHSTQALAIYTSIPDRYPTRPSAGLAWQNVVRINLDKGNVEGAVSGINNLKFMKARIPESYLVPYTFALAMLFDYYMNVLGDENTAEEYAKTLLRETGNTEIIERLYYTQAMKYTALEDMSILAEKITRLTEQNYRSRYLIGPLYNLSLMHYQAGEYPESKKILQDLIYWEDSTALGNLESDIRFRLAVVNFRMKNYSDAARQLEDWTEDYSEGSQRRDDLAPAAYWYLGYSFYYRAEEDESSSLENRAGYYRKAKRYLEYLAKNYSRTEFYSSDIDEGVERLINYCGKKVDELLKPR